MDRLAALFRHSVADPRSDGQLLAAFLTDRDELAFAELVRRHGSLVWGVCRRSLPDRADAEDAFQATFLVLVRRSNGLTAYPTVGPWLFKVAAWTARNLRRKNARRLARRSPFHDAITDPQSASAPSFEIDDLLLVLSERARAAVVLCHLQGLTHREAADRLGCPEGTVASLVSRGVAKLQARYATTLGVLVGVAVPASLSSATVRTAVSFHLSLPTVSPAVAELTRGVLRMFWAKKLATAVAVGMVLVAGLGVALGVRATPEAVAADDPQSAKEQAELRRTIERLAASQEQLRKDVESLMRSQERLTKELVAERTRGANGAAASSDVQTVVVLVGGPGQARYKAIERQPNGQVKWEVTFASGKPSDLAGLRAYLNRARRDPDGPRAIRVDADKNASREDVQAAAQVCREVGAIEVNILSDYVLEKAASPLPGATGSGAPRVMVDTFRDPDIASVTSVKMNVGEYARVAFDERILQAVPANSSSVVTVAGAGNDTKVVVLRATKAGMTDVLVHTADNKKHTLRVTVSEAGIDKPGM